MNSCIRTYPTKTLFDVFAPSEKDVHIEDIAHHLSREGRYANGTMEFFSVAQHSWHVSHLIPKPYALFGLLHDSSEAFLRDIPSPIKQLDLMRGYRVLEDRVQKTIYRAFGLCPEVPSELHLADHAAYLYEEWLLRNSPKKPEFEIPPEMAWAWSSEFAHEMFLSRFKELSEAE